MLLNGSDVNTVEKVKDKASTKTQIKMCEKYGRDSFILNYEFVDNFFIEKIKDINISNDCLLPLMSSYNYDGDTLTSLIKFANRTDIQFLEK